MFYRWIYWKTMEAAESRLLQDSTDWFRAMAEIAVKAAADGKEGIYFQEVSNLLIKKELRRNKFPGFYWVKTGVAMDGYFDQTAWTIGLLQPHNENHLMLLIGGRSLRTEEIPGIEFGPKIDIPKSFLSGPSAKRSRRPKDDVNLLNLSQKAKAALNQHDIKTIRQLKTLGCRRLLKKRGIGRVTLAEIKGAYQELTELRLPL